VKSVDNRKKTVRTMEDLNAASEIGNRKAWDELGDFTTTTRLFSVLSPSTICSKPAPGTSKKSAAASAL